MRNQQTCHFKVTIIDSVSQWGFTVVVFAVHRGSKRYKKANDLVKFKGDSVLKWSLTFIVLLFNVDIFVFEKQK